MALALVAAFVQAYVAFTLIGAAGPNRVISHKFIVSIKLPSEIVDLYAWQATVTFNPNVLLVSDVKNEGFLSSHRLNFNSSDLNDNTDSWQQLNAGDSIFMASYDEIEFGELVLGETRIGDVPGVSGSGKLVTITFGVYAQGDYNLKLSEATLFDSEMKPIEQVLLTGPVALS